MLQWLHAYGRTGIIASSVCYAAAHHETGGFCSISLAPSLSGLQLGGFQPSHECHGQCHEKYSTWSLVGVAVVACQWLWL